jgi:hypothetical protein
MREFDPPQGRLVLTKYTARNFRFPWKTGRLLLPMGLPSSKWIRITKAEIKAISDFPGDHLHKVIIYDTLLMLSNKMEVRRFFINR